MNSNTGKYFKKTARIQLGILCVRGPRKFQLIITTVARMEMQFIRNVNNRYLAISGTTSDVGGNIFETSNRNTTNDRRMDMPSVIFSPEIKSFNSITQFGRLMRGQNKLFSFVTVNAINCSCLPASAGK